MSPCKFFKALHIIFTITAMYYEKRQAKTYRNGCQWVKGERERERLMYVKLMKKKTEDFPKVQN